MKFDVGHGTSSGARAKHLSQEALITLETGSVRSSFCEISRSARDDNFNHRSRQFSRLPPIHDNEPVLQSPIADPSLRVPTVFHPTNFRKTNTGRVDRRFSHEYLHRERAKGGLHPTGQIQILPAEIFAALSAKYGGASSCKPRDMIPAPKSSALDCVSPKLAPTQKALSEMHLADAFLPKPEYRHDQRPEERSNEQAFLRADADCVT